MTEYIYLIKAKEYSKIGRTNDPTTRFSQYLCHNPYIDCIYIRNVENAEIAENFLLNRFFEKQLRENRDWFMLSDEDINYFLKFPLNENIVLEDVRESKPVPVSRPIKMMEENILLEVIELLRQSQREVNQGQLISMICRKINCSNKNARNAIYSLEADRRILFRCADKGAKFYRLEDKHA